MLYLHLEKKSLLKNTQVISPQCFLSGNNRGMNCHMFTVHSALKT